MRGARIEGTRTEGTRTSAGFRRFFTMLLALVGLLGGSVSWAHKASDAYLQLRTEGATATLRIDIALRDLDRDLVLDADDDGLLRWGEVRGRAVDIEALADRDLRLEVRDVRGDVCRPGPFAPLQLEQHSDGRYAVLARTWSCAQSPAVGTLSYRLFATTDPTHRGVLVWRQGGAAKTAVVAPGTAGMTLAIGAEGAGAASAAGAAGTDGGGGSGQIHGLAGIFRDGVHHIWIGVDHVLFLVVLLLPAVLRREAGQWRPAAAWRPALWSVLGVVTAFTVAHSITLALAVFDVVNPPSRWVESLIALSVLLAALNNLRPVLVETRWRLTFLFGLVHGFGFASALKDLGLARSELAAPLVLFNLGVEAGQLAIVAVLVPLAWAARRWRGYPRWVLGAGSAIVASIAIVWLVERLFDVQILGVGA
ncbi:HupE/UreJ family protein [Roseateles sp.]|uniref:HupE/UreJ family protein n=1 Tax=Roseateles sp. TaxID=1971397 RepID=UPI002F3E6891